MPSLYLGQPVHHFSVWVSLQTISGSGSIPICSSFLVLGQSVDHIWVRLYTNLYTISGSGSVCKPYLGQAVYQLWVRVSLYTISRLTDPCTQVRPLHVRCTEMKDHVVTIDKCRTCVIHLPFVTSHDVCVKSRDLHNLLF